LRRRLDLGILQKDSVATGWEEELMRLDERKRLWGKRLRRHMTKRKEGWMRRKISMRRRHRWPTSGGRQDPQVSKPNAHEEVPAMVKEAVGR
jgi:hypothetical protein